MKRKFKATLKALQHLRSDSGIEVEARVLLRWHDQLPKIERALSKLKPRDLETFAIGDQHEQEAFLGSAGMRLAHKFLDQVFEGGMR